MKIYPPGSTLPPPPPVVVPPPPPPPPIKARVIGVKVQGDAVVVTISAGSAQKVDKSWTARVMRGDTKEPMLGAHVEIFRVDEKMTFARVTGLTVDQVNANPLIVLQAP
jgi:hypothetical protein